MSSSEQQPGASVEIQTPQRGFNAVTVCIFNVSRDSVRSEYASRWQIGERRDSSAPTGEARARSRRPL